jgi:putative transposase
VKILTSFKKISPQKIQKTLLDDLTKEEIEKAKRQINTTEQKPIYLTTKIKISPTEEQKEILWALAENCRLIYYFALKERIEWWEQNKHLPKEKRDNSTKPTYVKQARQIKILRRQYPRYQQNYCRTLQTTLRRLDNDMKSFYVLRNKCYFDANPPRFPSKKYFTTIIYQQYGYKIEDNKITFSHFYKTNESKSVNLSFELNNTNAIANKEIKQASIFQNHKTKEFYLSITYNEVPINYQDNTIYQAIDLGVMNIIASVNSHVGKSLIIKNNRVDKYWQPKIDELKSKRDHCLKYSNRWYWYNNKLQKIKRKQTNQLKNFQHQLSRKLIDNTKANTIIVGDLKVKEMCKSNSWDKKNVKSTHRALHNTGCISRFTGFLTYKAQLVGKRVIRINEKRTTKRCCKCMDIQIRHLSERIIQCKKCGLVIDRDINGAVNILQRFLAIISLLHKRLVVRQHLLKAFREKFFAIHSQTSNGSFSSNGVVRTRRKSQ